MSAKHYRKATKEIKKNWRSDHSPWKNKDKYCKLHSRYKRYDYQRDVYYCPDCKFNIDLENRMAISKIAYENDGYCGFFSGVEFNDETPEVKVVDERKLKTRRRMNRKYTRTDKRNAIFDRYTAKELDARFDKPVPAEISLTETKLESTNNLLNKACRIVFSSSDSSDTSTSSSTDSE